ncbi:recombinase family protein [Oscillatoria sp. FACHB-1406]|uniref:recombinase family protein n=1 Tax=Oscillatoria sp. FACHB-1406 TaxID=2692846 RepID=UPI00168A0C10|nr:recombinase family protein [Oscillatoria sp. FACHB-1406]
MSVIAYLYGEPLLDSLADAKIEGIHVDRVYQDRCDRSQWQQLLADSEKQPPECLLVRRLDELGDNLEEIDRALAQLEALQIPFIAAETADNRTAPLSLVHNLHRHRLRQGHARNRIKALPPPGKACYGYRRGKDRYILDRSTAPVVKDFFDRYLLFGSLRGAVRYLEQKYGKKISVTTGRRWLANPVYRGDTAYQTGEVIPDTHAPILSREEAAQIDRLLRRNRRLPPRTASAPRSLAGLVFCQQCQSPTTITRVAPRGKSQEYLYLRPVCCTKNPKCQAIPYGELLERAIACICEQLPRAVANLQGSPIRTISERLAAQIAQKEEIIAQIPTLVEKEILDEETADLRRYNLRAEIARLRQSLAELPPPNLDAIAQTVSIPQFWFDLSEAERRFYFREFLRQIEIVRDGRNWTLELIFIF